MKKEKTIMGPIAGKYLLAILFAIVCAMITKKGIMSLLIYSQQENPTRTDMEVLSFYSGIFILFFLASIISAIAASCQK